MRYCFAVALATGRVSVRHRGSGKGARVLHGPPAGDTREGCVCWRVLRTPSASTVRGATLCCYLGEYVTVTRTFCRVVDGPEAYIINMCMSCCPGDCRSVPPQQLTTPSIPYEMGDLISSSPISLARAFNLEEVLKSSYVSARQI